MPGSPPTGTGVAINAQVSVTDARITAPVSVTSRWTTIIDATGMDDVDAVTITDPNAEIITAMRHVFRRAGKAGTLLRLRLAYDDGVTVTTEPIIKVFGRTESDAWEILPNLDGTLSVTMQIALTTDASDGTLNFTTPGKTEHTWDCDGCDEIIVGV